MSDDANDRVRRWFNDEPEGFSLGIARDILAMEGRVAALEGNRQATPDSSPAADGEWRMLEVGTVQEAGDQLGSADYGWQDIDPANIGRRVGLLDIIRRRVKPAMPATDVEALRAECDRLRAENERLKKDNGWWRVEYNKELATLEQRFADLRRKSDAANAKCERLEAENERLRQQIAAPIDVDAFRPEFEKLLDEEFRMTHQLWQVAWYAVTAFAARLNAAARKEVDGE